MRFRTIMVDEDTYSRLSEARTELRSSLQSPASYGDVIRDLLSRRLDLLGMDPRLTDYIAAVAGEVGKLSFVEGVLLFGSVAKGRSGSYSDIDLAVMVNGSRGHMREIIEAIGRVSSKADELMEMGLPSLVSPVVLTTKALHAFRPFHFDLADSGILLYDRVGAFSDFLYSLKRVDHKRERTEAGEVVTWKRRRR